MESSPDGRVVACVYCGSSESVAIDPRALAAGFARDAASLHQSFDHLAAIFEETLPEHTTVHRSGLFTKKVDGFEVGLEELTFRMKRHGKKVEGERVTTVRGITLRTDRLDLDEWLTALASKLSDMAASSSAARQAFGRIAKS